MTRLQTKLAEAQSRTFVFDDMIKSLAQSQQDLQLTKDTNEKLNERMSKLLEDQDKANTAVAAEKAEWQETVKNLRD